MDIIISTYEMLAGMYGVWGLLLMAVLLALFVLQLCYYLGPYWSVAKYRNRDGNPKRQIDGISVVLTMGNDRWYVENVLPRLMKQKFPRFEVVIVTVGADADFIDELSLLKMRYPNLSVTSIDEDMRFPISKKMALNVGIKAAAYENIVITTSDAAPVSGKWLDCMALGFARNEILIAYCGIEPRKMAGIKAMRSSRFMMSVRYLASAIKGRPYRGIIHNLGITKNIYFSNRGFDHLNMNLGEDDLFISRIARQDNTGVVINPHATVRQNPRGGLGWWREQERFYASAFRYYPQYAKSTREWESGSRLLFFACAILAACIMPFELKIAAGAMFLIRMILVRLSMWRIRLRLGEPNLGFALMLYDLYSPVTDILSYFYRLLRPAPGVWR